MGSCRFSRAVSSAPPAAQAASSRPEEGLDVRHVDAVAGMVVDGMDPLQAEPGCQARGDLVGLVVALADLAELLHQRRAQAVAGAALGLRQLQPLHIGRGAVARRHEHGGQAPPLRRARLRGPGFQRLVDLGHRGRYVEPGRRLGRLGRRAVIGAVFGRMARGHIAFVAGLFLDGDDRRPEGGQPVEHAVQRCRIESGRHPAQVHRAQHQDLGTRTGHAAVERGQIDLRPAWAANGNAAMSTQVQFCPYRHAVFPCSFCKARATAQQCRENMKGVQERTDELQFVQAGMSKTGYGSHGGAIRF